MSRNPRIDNRRSLHIILLIGAALAEATAIYGFVLGILIILMVK